MENNEFQSSDQGLVTIAKGASILIGGMLIGSGLRYLNQIIIARNLEPKSFGLFFLGFAVIQVAGILAEMGLPAAMLKYVAVFQSGGDERRIKGVIKSALKLGLLSSFVVTALIFLLSNVLAVKIFHNFELVNVLTLFAFTIPFTTLTTIMVFFTQGFKIMKYAVAVREIFEPLGRFLVLIVLFIFGLKIFGAVFAYLLVSVFGTILSFHYLKTIFPQFTRVELQPIYETRNLLNFSWILLIGQFCSLLNLWMATIMLGYFRTPEEVGIFSAAQRMALLSRLPITAFNSIFAPMVSELYTKKNFLLLSGYLKTIAKWTFTFNFPIILLMIFFVKQILNIFGSEFIAGETSLIILSLGWLILTITGSASQIIIMFGRPKLNLLNISFILFTSMILNLIFIPTYGIIGASSATATAIGLGSIIVLIEVYALFKIHPYRLNFLKPLIAGCISFGALSIFEKYILQANNLTSILILILVYVGLYAMILCFFKFDEDDKIILNRLKMKLFLGLKN